jgi:hypothetical protein
MGSEFPAARVVDGVSTATLDQKDQRDCPNDQGILHPTLQPEKAHRIDHEDKNRRGCKTG